MSWYYNKKSDVNLFGQFVGYWSVGNFIVVVGDLQ